MKVHDQSLPVRKVYTGMPVYNGEPYVEASLRSNLAQTFDDFGILVTDNASTDRTEEICRDLAASDERLIYRRNEKNLGASKNYTLCFTPSRSQYFRWSNADDLIAPTMIEKCVAVLDARPDVVLTYGKTQLIDQDGELIRHYDDGLNLSQDTAFERFVMFRKSIGLSNVLCGLMRRETLANTSLLASYVASDINLIGELALYGKFHEIPEELFFRRIHPKASSWDREDTDGQKNFLDPTKRQLTLQQWHSALAYLNAVDHAPIDDVQKRKIKSWLRKRMLANRRKLTLEIVEYLRHKLSLKSRKAGA